MRSQATPITLLSVTNPEEPIIAQSGKAAASISKNHLNGSKPDSVVRRLISKGLSRLGRFEALTTNQYFEPLVPRKRTFV